MDLKFFQKKIFSPRQNLKNLYRFLKNNFFLSFQKIAISIFQMRFDADPVKKWKEEQKLKELRESGEIELDEEDQKAQEEEDDDGPSSSDKKVIMGV